MGLTADRIRLGATYRYRLGEMLPRLGPLVGWELQRFEVDDPEIVSGRFSVLRAGASVRQPFVDAQGALRLAPGGSGSSTAPGFDVGGFVVARFDFGLHAQAGAAARFQRGTLGSESYTERFIDVLAAVGWSF